MIGDALSGSSGPPSYTPSWSNFTAWSFQAQYFFAVIDRGTNGTVLKAVTGATFQTTAGESLWTSFSFSPGGNGGGVWTLSMGVEGDESRTSAVVIPQPYMGLLAPVTSRWDEDIYSVLHVNSCWELYGTNCRADYPSSGSNFTMVIDQSPGTFPWEVRNWSSPGTPPDCPGHPVTDSRERHNRTTQIVEWDIFWP